MSVVSDVTYVDSLKTLVRVVSGVTCVHGGHFKCLLSRV